MDPVAGEARGYRVAVMAVGTGASSILSHRCDMLVRLIPAAVTMALTAVCLPAAERMQGGSAG